MTRITRIDLKSDSAQTMFAGSLVSRVQRLSRRDALTAVAALAVGCGRTEPLATEEKPVAISQKFVPPDAARRRQAIGSLKGLKSQVARAFEPGEDFVAMGAPAPGDWLDKHKEPGQTFDDYVNSLFNRLEVPRTTIYLQPLGEFDGDWSPKIADLQAVTTAFFQTPVKALPPRSMADYPLTQRERMGSRQYLTGDILGVLSGLLPRDGYAILGITMQDLYSRPDWNWVFGQGSLMGRVGIYSFARFDPQFFDEPRTPDSPKQMLVRSLGVLLHETCHMFGMQHCIYYRCLVNGSNSLEESDRTPLRECPVCLRKLQHAAGFDIVTRYEALRREYRRLKIDHEAEWLDQRLKFVLS